jgi:hypothetical protein
LQTHREPARQSLRLIDKPKPITAEGMMNHSIYSADRTTHLKVVVLALVAATAVLVGSIAARVGTSDISSVSSQTASAKVHGPVVKAGAPVVVTATDSQVTR